MKPCTKCGETKALADFHRHPDRPNGRMSACMECERKRALARYYAKREEILARARTPEEKLKRKMRRMGA